MKPNWITILGAPALALLTRNVIDRNLNKNLLRDNNKLPYTRNSEIDALKEKIKQRYGLDVGIEHMPNKLDSNAVYVDINTKEHGRHGTVVTGKFLKRPGVIEHELGHAIITHRGTPLERKMNNEFLQHGLPGLGTAAGIYAGVKGALSGRPVLGTAIGAGIGLASNIPKIYNEMAANRYARTLIDDKYQDRVSYAKPLSTYITRAIAAPITTGVLAALSEHLIKKFKK